jgi:hypothetical protein
MTDSPGSPTRQSQTNLEVKVSFRIGDTEWALDSIIQGGGDWAFKATPAKKLRILDAVNALCLKFGGDADLFTGDMLPVSELESLTLSDSGNSVPGSVSCLKALAEIGINKKNGDKWFQLIVAFAKLGKGPMGEPGGYLAGIRSAGHIALATGSDGVVGQLLGDVFLDGLGLYYASDAINYDPFAAKDQASARTFPQGISIACRFGVRNSSVDVALSSTGLTLSSPDGKQNPARLPPPNETAPAVPPNEPEPAKVPDGRYWKSLDKTLGPLQLRRIGGEWVGNKLGLLLDATIELAGLKVALAGLVVRVPPSKLSKLTIAEVEVGLDGLELDFQRGAISISGALMKTKVNGSDMYSGMASIRLATFSIGAIGSYGTANGQPSFFIFGAYSGMLGGPPCFVIEGIAAGFGFNRAITVPDIDKVRDFPLVTLVLGKSPGSSGNMLETLGSGKDFPPAIGQYWIAAGVKFSSFKLVEGFALATVQFGARLEIALLGVATLKQPPSPAPRPFIVVEMALKVRFAPDDGLLSVQAVLTANSYLFDPSCRLTGGFAFFVWFKPTNPEITNRAGDFVLTLGGYHPKFDFPGHYPRVPRVGFNWQLPECGVTIKGEAYFALTPSFVMAGVRLSAVFRAGAFSAWFEAYADFLIGWEPFHYEAEVGVRIGASYTFRIGEIVCTLSFELAARLTLWGPPFAGEAFVDLGIVAFTLPIGDRTAARTAEPLTWPEFAGKFLAGVDKSNPAPLDIAITSGMIYEFRDRTAVYTVVKPSELSLSVESLVPVTSLANNTLCRGKAWERQSYNTKLGIRPMQLTQFASTLSLELSAAGDVFEHFPIIKNMPEALWSPNPIPDVRKTAAIKSNVIENCLMGVGIKAKECLMNDDIKVTIEIGLKQVSLNKPSVGLGFAPDMGQSTIKQRRVLLQDKLSNAQIRDARKAAVDAIILCRFDIESDLANVEQYSDHSSMLVKSPWFVPIGKQLPLQQIG